MHSNIVLIPAGRAYVGTAKPVISGDGEGPVRRQRIGEFWMDSATVTNARFQQFVAETGYVTEAEEIGWSFAFHSHIPTAFQNDTRVAAAQWWQKIEGANWRDVNGPGTSANCLPEHPVVQVSKRDAEAFATWSGGRLPSEAEWEHAARGGQGDVRFPWGEAEPDDDDFQPCNIWQGSFPHTNMNLDGYSATAPAISFAPNPYGLYNLCGNVWEWTASPFRIRSMTAAARKREKASHGHYVMKGGSFMCHKSYCYRYRIAARTGTTPDSATSHQGFRVVYDRDKQV